MQQLHSAAQSVIHRVMKQVNLKGWREGEQLTQAEAAKRLGLGLRIYKHYELGTREVPLKIRLAFAAVVEGYTDYHGPARPKGTHHG